MTDLGIHLERLGLEQYLDVFIEEGFDTWDTLLDVQESDLEALSVKLGHRRKLQRAIAEHRGVTYERLVTSPAVQDGIGETPRSVTDSSQGTSAAREVFSGTPTEGKRKYRRHPKSDENAPEKPPSAYVLFSNKVREEVKGDNMTFAEIARLVGDRWQKLEPEFKEPFETQAATLKEQYIVRLSAYKKTDKYKEYAQYLTEFRSRHGIQTDPKRPKLDAQSSGGSMSAVSVEAADVTPVPGGLGQVGSLGGTSAASLTSGILSSTGVPIASIPPLTNTPNTSARGNLTPQQPTSPQSHSHRDRGVIGQISNQSSTSDDSGQALYDPLSRTATLSLSTPPTGTPPLPQQTTGTTKPEQSSTVEGYTWPTRGGQQTHQQGSVTPSGPSPLGSSITLPSPTFSTEPWRERSAEWTRPLQTSPSTPMGTHAPALSVNSLLAPERPPDLGHGQVQRILPPLRQSHPSVSSPVAFQGLTATNVLSRQVSVETERRFSQSYDASNRQLDRNDNEAANTLAGLAARPLARDNPRSRSRSGRNGDGGLV